MEGSYLNIQEWMLPYGKTMNERATFAIIYQFSAEGNGVFFGNLDYICKWVGVDRRTVLRYLKDLRDSGVIECEEGGVGKMNRNYRVVVGPGQNAQEPRQNIPEPRQNIPEPRQNVAVYNIKYNNKYYNININSDADFLDALEQIGVSHQTATDWMTVRKKLKASNTLTAFKTLVSEIEKSGKTPEECVAVSAANSWRGFKAEWLSDEKSPAPKVISTEDYFRMREEGKL